MKSCGVPGDTSYVAGKLLLKEKKKKKKEIREMNNKKKIKKKKEKINYLLFKTNDCC